MAIIKCKMCGGDLILTEGQSVAECEYCGSRQTVPAADNEKKLTLFGRANRLRSSCDFDKAAGIYESIIADFPGEAEAYWGLVLCKYGIEYVDDPATGKKVPTCHRSSFESVLDDSDFEQAMENADVSARKVYREEAKAIEQIRKGIIQVSANEEPYDIFICYKETDEKGERTLDSVLAQDLYDTLTEKGYRTFFARITLEDKLGQEYEPYIFAALNSAKIMVAIGTDYEYFNAVWVKNEWSRYLKLMEKDKSKHLIPCYKGIDAYDMPKEFARLQAQNLGKMGAIQDIMRGVEKLISKNQNKGIITEKTDNDMSNPLLRRAYMFLEEGKWTEADTYCERVLDLYPESTDAYVGKLMAQKKICTKENLKNCADAIGSNEYFQKAIRFANPDLKEYLETVSQQIDSRIENARKESIYQNAIRCMNSAHSESELWEIAKKFDRLAEFKDSAMLAQNCRKKAEEIIAERKHKEAEIWAAQMAEKSRIQTMKDSIIKHNEKIEKRMKRYTLVFFVLGAFFMTLFMMRFETNSGIEILFGFIVSCFLQLILIGPVGIFTILGLWSHRKHGFASRILVLLSRIIAVIGVLFFGVGILASAENGIGMVLWCVCNGAANLIMFVFPFLRKTE